MNRITMLLIFQLISLVAMSQSDIRGAWKLEKGETASVYIFTDQFFAVSSYRVSDGTFEGTRGGKYEKKGSLLLEIVEFDTWKSDDVGMQITVGAVIKDGQLLLTRAGELETLTRVDAGTPGQLAGAWLITGRMQEGTLQKMTPGARRTMKIMSGSRFQWIAYNVETHEFFGTGGGTYTTREGQYTEQIEFFSRDKTRVGIRLTFQFTLDGEGWHHKGKSSKGEPIDEVWTQREKLGL